MPQRRIAYHFLAATTCLAVMLGHAIATAGEPQQLDLWPAAAPGEEDQSLSKGTVLPDKGDQVVRIAEVEFPTLALFPAPAENNSGAMVLICPGGGYNHLSMNKEGTEFAEFLNRVGVNAAVMTYRVPRRKGQPKHLAPLQDAQRAMRLLRAKSKELNINPDKVGVMGSSAGGHLAAMLSTSYDQDAYAPIDKTDKLSSRPDFAVLVYPAYMFKGDQLVDEIRVTKQTPPAVMFHADDDRHSALSSVVYYTALKKAGVPTALHIFPDGGHGFGMRDSGGETASAWPNLLASWLRSQKLIEKKPTE